MVEEPGLRLSATTQLTRSYNMSYKLTLNPECVFRIADSTYITKCSSNSSWDGYEKWLAEGNTPLPADEQGETK